MTESNERLTVDGLANTCTHGSGVGIDTSEIGPEKVWACTHCGFRWREDGQPVSASRGTGGNRFIPADAGLLDLRVAIEHGLGDLMAYANRTGRSIDYGALTVETRRIRDGRISVSVTGDLANATAGASS